MTEKNCCDCKFYDGSCCMYDCNCRAILHERRSAENCEHFLKGSFDEDWLEETGYQGTKDLSFEELQQQPEGSVVSMGCRECEGFEKHERVQGAWTCQHCGHKLEMSFN